MSHRYSKSNIVQFIAVICFAILPILAHAQPASSTNEEGKKVWLKAGTTLGDFGTMVREFVIPAMKERGYRVDLTEIKDIVIPNISVDQETLDFNIFQHKPFMEEYNEKNDGHLYALTQVPTAPFGIYPGKSKSPADIHEGAIIAIPSDTINYSRALWILEAFNWIKLHPGADRFQLSADDIIEDPYHLNIKVVDGSKTPKMLKKADFAIISGNYAQDAGIPFSEAIIVEPGKYFINWVVINEKNKDEKWAKDLKEVLNSQAFKDFTAEKFPNYNLPSSWGQSK